WSSSLQPDAAMMGGVLHFRKSPGGALVLNAVDPIMVQGAAFADCTMISGFDRDITRAISNGAMVEVDDAPTSGSRGRQLQHPGPYSLKICLDYVKCPC